jgi:hypothetical protein
MALSSFWGGLYFLATSPLKALLSAVRTIGSSLFGVGKAFEDTPWENRLFGYSPSCEETSMKSSMLSRYAFCNTPFGVFFKKM